jgi:IS5 family transposase
MFQISFSEIEYLNKKRKTRKEIFLARMEKLIPWQEIEAMLHPIYRTSKKGRSGYALSTMLRVHCMQLFYNLSDPAMEDALYEIESMRRFAGLNLAGPIPDETTILNFRHLLEKHQLGKAIFEIINDHLAKAGCMFKEGTIVDATIIAAPTSTKNSDGERDPEMHQTKKGNQWYFGMKMHAGVDDTLGLIHSIETTAANEHDITAADKVMHGEEQRFWGDAGYQGIQKRDEHKGKKIDWFVALRPSSKERKNCPNEELLDSIEHHKASVRAKVEHVFFYIKRMFGYSKVRYRGLAKNTNRLYVLGGFTNLLKAEPYMTA